MVMQVGGRYYEAEALQQVLMDARREVERRLRLKPPSHQLSLVDRARNVLAAMTRKISSIPAGKLTSIEDMEEGSPPMPLQQPAAAVRHRSKMFIEGFLVRPSLPPRFPNVYRPKSRNRFALRSVFGSAILIC